MDADYPIGPEDVPVELTRPTKVYKRKAWLAVASLAVFMILYMALAGWFVWTAYRLLHEGMAGGPNAAPNIGVGICAGFLAVFMLKAIFFIQRSSAPDALEISEKEQPRLFAFLYRLADEAGAPRPRRVYLSARVNASVFYDLSILNLLAPSKKNLEIGLALVNVLTLSELKAVLAHEFGHFAQRSMAIGSWVYIAQQIAAQIVARRDILDKTLRTLSNLDVRIAWVGWLLSLIVWSIRSLMDTLLSIVVLAQRALSRQMEFQADLVAVSLTGSDELVHALHKLQAADDAWMRALNFAADEQQKGRLPHDLFVVQSRIIEKMSHILDDPTYGNLPAGSSTQAEKNRIFKSSFAQPPQMWATHPANADREANAKRRYVGAPHDGRSAWLLFDDVEPLKQRVAAPLLDASKASPATAAETLAALEERYAMLQFETRYRGAYLGRFLTRHESQPAALYATIRDEEILRTLDHLYPAQLSADLAKLRELREERSILEALRDKTFRATGERLVHRGREVSRRDLPQAIIEVKAEEETVNERVLHHDRSCRGAHLAAASRLGEDWRDYLAGLLAVLHYAEHTEMNLRDAHGAFGNVFAIVTAGKITDKGLKRLIKSANQLHDVLQKIYVHKNEPTLDKPLLDRLKLESWTESLEDFRLPPASEGNINEWLKAIDGWVNATSGALGALSSAALEQLLLTEDIVAGHLRNQTLPGPAATPSRVPAEYPVLLVGQERKRQKRLDLWTRFQIADGLFPAFARLLVAGAIVGSVLGFASFTGLTSQLYIYNGLARTIQVKAGTEELMLGPLQTRTIDVQLDETSVIEARTGDDRLIETFSPTLQGHSQHYVYNVAAAAPLVEWTARYGPMPEVPPRFLGNPRWMTAHSDVIFSTPPQSVKTSGGGATRTVLDGGGHLSPLDMLKALNNDNERRTLVEAHVKWDNENAANTSLWKAVALRIQ